MPADLPPDALDRDITVAAELIADALRVQSPPESHCDDCRQQGCPSHTATLIIPKLLAPLLEDPRLSHLGPQGSGDLAGLVPLTALVAAYHRGRRDAEEDLYRQGLTRCCAFACAARSCQACPCCRARWCVMGRDGIPGDGRHWATTEDRERWLDLAAPHNAVAAALAAHERGSEYAS